MAVELPSQEELWELYKNEVQARNAALTDFEEGSTLDAIGGGLSTAGEEILKRMLDLFAKTYLATANGPSVTGGPDDLETLAVDHWGDGFARPEASPAVGIVTFTRPNALAGDCVIAVGTIVKTEKDANGNEQRFSVVSEVTMVGTTINASVEAVEPGTDGNVNADTVTEIESALTDPSIVVTNDDPFAGGEEEATDAEYREFIRNKIEIIRGATKAAIEASALNVPGVEIATAIEDVQSVKEWDIGGDLPVGDVFYIPRARLFIADANGSANDALVALVVEAIEFVRAAGVQIRVYGATPLLVDWTATVTFNPSGPNFAELSVDTTRIEQSMAQYIRDLPIGTGFDKGLAKLAIMAIWGPSGTDDLTDFVISVPTGNISATATQKLIPDDIEASP